MNDLDEFLSLSSKNDKITTEELQKLRLKRVFTNNRWYWQWDIGKIDILTSQMVGLSGIFIPNSCLRNGDIKTFDDAMYAILRLGANLREHKLI